MTALDFLKRLFGRRNANPDTSGETTVIPPDTSGKTTAAAVPSEGESGDEADPHGET